MNFQGRICAILINSSVILLVYDAPVLTFFRQDGVSHGWGTFSMNFFLFQQLSDKSISYSVLSQQHWGRMGAMAPSEATTRTGGGADAVVARWILLSISFFCGITFSSVATSATALSVSWLK